jgi:hypothetical protein
MDYIKGLGSGRSQGGPHDRDDGGGASVTKRNRISFDGLQTSQPYAKSGKSKQYRSPKRITDRGQTRA